MCQIFSSPVLFDSVEAEDKPVNQKKCLKCLQNSFWITIKQSQQTSAYSKSTIEIVQRLTKLKQQRLYWLLLWTCFTTSSSVIIVGSEQVNIEYINLENVLKIETKLICLGVKWPTWCKYFKTKFFILKVPMTHGRKWL